MRQVLGTADLVALALSLATLALLAAGWRRAMRADVKALFAGVLALAAFHNLSNTFEWLLGMPIMDPVEDYIELLRPVFWGLFFYAFLQAQAQRKLRESEQRNRMLLASLPHRIFFKDAESRFVSVNEEFARDLGVTPEEVVGKTDGDFFPEDLTAKYRADDRRVMETRKPETLVEQNVAYGRDRFVEVVKSPVVNDEGDVVGLLGVFTDITERVRSAEDLRESQERYRLIFENATDIIGLHSLEDLSYVYVNPATSVTLGYSQEELLGSSVVDFVHPDDREQVRQRFQEGVARGVGRAEFRYRKKDGDYVWLESTGKVTVDENGRPVALVISRDVTERVQRREELRALSLEDPLTGVSNRRGFSLLAEQQLKVANRTGNVMLLFFADVDRMKWINDNCGHKEGDLALIEAANVLRESFRESDIIARVGGDEFAVLAIETGGSRPADILIRLHERIAHRNKQPDRKYRLSLSVGIATYDPADPQPLDELMARADALMYEQKRTKQQQQ